MKAKSLAFLLVAVGTLLVSAEENSPILGSRYRNIDGKVYDFGPIVQYTSEVMAGRDTTGTRPPKDSRRDWIVYGTILQVTDQGLLVHRINPEDLHLIFLSGEPRRHTIFLRNSSKQDTAIDNQTILEVAKPSGRYQYTSVTGAINTIPAYDCGMTVTTKPPDGQIIDAEDVVVAEALERNPNDGRAYFIRGQSKLRKSDYKGAIADCSKAIQLGFDISIVYSQRAKAKDALSDHDGALLDSTLATDIKPMDSDFGIVGHAAAGVRIRDYFDAGQAASVGGNYDKAIHEWTMAIAILRRYQQHPGDEAIELEPSLADAHSQRGKAEANKGDYAGAISDYTAGIRYTLGTSTVSAVSEQADRSDEERKKYAPSLKLLLAVFDLRAQAEIEVRNFEEAIRDESVAISLDPTNANAYGLRGWSEANKGDYDGAIADYTKAIELNPKHSGAYENRGEAKRAKGDQIGAIADYSMAIGLNPKDVGTLLERRCVVNLCLANGKAASEDARSYLEQQGWRDNYSLYMILFTHFGCRYAGDTAQAQTILMDAAAKCNTTEWPYPVIRLLRRELTDSELLSAATNNDEMTEAQAYIGLDASLTGRKQDAVTHLTWVKQNGNKAFDEFAIAAAELRRLESQTSSTSN